MGVNREKTAATLSARLSTVYTRLSDAVPGVLVCVTIALATTFIADNYGGPVMLYALLFGMAFNFLSEEGRCVPGIDLAARTILRLGVALLGTRITLAQITGLGFEPVLVVVTAVVATVVTGWLVARALGLGRDLGLLTGGAVAICGASAALALSAVMPHHATSERNTILTVVGVTIMATTAMVLYPLLVGILNLSDGAAGVFLGGTIHDVAQVVGAGYMISTETGDVSTFIKLFRVAMLVPAVLAFSFIFRQARDAEGAHTSGKPPMLPGFLLAFVALVVVNSAGWIPVSLGEGLTDLSRWCLVTAIAALGTKTSLQKLAVVGWKPVLLMATETAVIGLLVLGSVLFLGVTS